MNHQQNHKEFESVYNNNSTQTVSLPSDSSFAPFSRVGATAKQQPGVRSSSSYELYTVPNQHPVPGLTSRRKNSGNLVSPPVLHCRALFRKGDRALHLTCFPSLSSTTGQQGGRVGATWHVLWARTKLLGKNYTQRRTLLCTCFKNLGPNLRSVRCEVTQQW